MNQKKLPDDLVTWEHYDHSLTALENFNELIIQMGFLNEANELIKAIQKPNP